MKHVKKILGVLLAVCILLGGIIPVCNGSIRE